MLQQLSQILAGDEVARETGGILIPDLDLEVAANPHEQVRKGEAVIPELDHLLASPDDARIDERRRPKAAIGHVDEDDPLTSSDLRGGNRPAKTVPQPEIGESLPQVRDRLRRPASGKVIDLERRLAEERITQQEDFLNCHMLCSSLTADYRIREGSLPNFVTRKNCRDGAQTILFDFDGTLVNTTPLILRSYQATWETHFGFSFDDRTYIGTFGTHLHSSLGELIDLGVEHGRHNPPADREKSIGELLATYRHFNLGWHDEMVEPFPEVESMLRQIRERGLVTGIVSSKMQAGVERGLRLFDLGHYFDLIVAAEHVTRHKPDPEPIRVALDRLAAPAGQALYLGDSTHDMIAGRAAGVRTAAAAWGPFERAELEATAPDFILDTPGALPGIV